MMFWGSIRFRKTFVLGMGMGMGMIRMAEVFEDASRAVGEIVVISGGFAGDSRLVKRHLGDGGHI